MLNLIKEPATSDCPVSQVFLFEAKVFHLYIWIILSKLSRVVMNFVTKASPLAELIELVQGLYDICHQLVSLKIMF